jgi:anti-anti-sigma factor
MESIERIAENYAVVFNVNLIRATLNEASEFKDLLSEVILDTDKDIIVNLSPCEHLDSTFLGVLVSSYKKLKSQNRSLVIIEPIDQSSIFLTLNSIGKIFPLYTSVKVALEDIENKRLIEKEINQLGDDKAGNSTKVNHQSSIHFVDHSVRDEKHFDEQNAEQNLSSESQDNIEEVAIPKEETPILEDDPGVSLFEHVENRVEVENQNDLKTEENTSEEKNEVIENKDLEETENKLEKKENEKEKSPFGDTVKWEFGISS